MKIRSAQISTPVMLMLSVTLAQAIAIADDVDVTGALLSGALDLAYAGHPEKTDGEGRLLVWEGSIAGDFAGKIR